MYVAALLKFAETLVESCSPFLDNVILNDDGMPFHESDSGAFHWSINSSSSAFNDTSLGELEGVPSSASIAIMVEFIVKRLFVGLNTGPIRQ